LNYSYSILSTPISVPLYHYSSLPSLPSSISVQISHIVVLIKSCFVYTGQHESYVWWFSPKRLLFFLLTLIFLLNGLVSFDNLGFLWSRRLWLLRSHFFWIVNVRLLIILLLLKNEYKLVSVPYLHVTPRSCRSFSWTLRSEWRLWVLMQFLEGTSCILVHACHKCRGGFSINLCGQMIVRVRGKLFIVKTYSPLCILELSIFLHKLGKQDLMLLPFLL
jgi:hypothetical protein